MGGGFRVRVQIFFVGRGVRGLECVRGVEWVVRVWPSGG